MKSLAAPLLLLAASCSGSPSSETVSHKPWKDQDHEERMVTMKKRVWPAMKSEFMAFDAKEYSDFTCGTCHGPGAKDKTFKMPNPKLPKLPATEAGFEELRKKHGDMVRFMTETVVPRMAAFVGEAPYDPKTREGFGCFRCHPKDAQPGN